MAVPRARPHQPNDHTLNRVCYIAAELASLPKWVAPHSLRHNSESWIIPSHLLAIA
jgi:hypothetical protein